MGEQNSDTKWVVVMRSQRKYVTGASGGLAWTTDRAEAEQTAQMVGGEVVDAVYFAKSWRKFFPDEGGD